MGYGLVRRPLRLPRYEGTDLLRGAGDALARRLLRGRHRTAEAEAGEYTKVLSLRYLGLAQAYKLADEPGDAAEVFSLYRESDLEAGAYLTAFFDTGTECQRNL